MGDTKFERHLRRQTWFLRLIGVVLLGIGMFAAFLGPLEMFCFYLFSEGGVFHYEGFGFGSFMFGNISAQIFGYYFIAASTLPIGYGNLKQKRWARHLTLGLLQSWHIVGLPLMIAFFAVLVSSKDVSWVFAGLTGLLALACYLFLPGLVKRFYNNTNTKRLFAKDVSDQAWIEGIPIPVIALGYVFVFVILILHTQIFFNGIFPFFGFWMNGFGGIVLIDLAIVSLVVLLWGVLRVQPWAWWGGLIFFSSMFISYTLTLVLSSWDEMLAVFDFPAFELQFLGQIPLHGTFFAVLAGFPFLLTIISILRTRSFFHR
ncbi:MAG: hypothetical protein PVI78_07145 [Anaerolineales bacterium]|jgi:hypothetical protein